MEIGGEGDILRSLPATGGHTSQAHPIRVFPALSPGGAFQDGSMTQVAHWVSYWESHARQTGAAKQEE